MKISDQTVSPSYQTNPLSPVDPQGQLSDSNETTSTDSADLSDAAKLVARLESDSASRVMELRARVADGTYRIDAEAVSRKLIDSMSSE